MDTLDKISALTIAILVVSAATIVSRQVGEAKPMLRKEATLADAGRTGDLAAGARAVRNLMEAGNLDKAEAIARDLANRYPFEGELRMLLGDIHFRRQEPVEAVLEYRNAVELNPDYLDKKTPLFQGKKLKKAVQEAMDTVRERMQRDPGDATLVQARQIIHYMQRRIAGSCG